MNTLTIPAPRLALSPAQQSKLIRLQAQRDEVVDASRTAARHLRDARMALDQLATSAMHGDPARRATGHFLLRSTLQELEACTPGEREALGIDARELQQVIEARRRLDHQTARRHQMAADSQAVCALVERLEAHTGYQGD